MNKNKQARYRKIFAKSRKLRYLSASYAIDLMKFPQLFARFSNNGAMVEWSKDQAIIEYLNKAAPIAIDMGHGWIKCNSFGSIQDELISYRPRERRKDCTALVIGIRLSEIKRIKII
jgi:hypothetical protein